MSLRDWFKKHFSSRSSIDDTRLGVDDGGYGRYTDLTRERQLAGLDARQVVEGELSEYEGPSE